MAEVRFYHLMRQRLEDTLPVMLERTVNRDQRRAVVLARSQERLETLNVHLWTYDERGFLPHGSRGDGFAADQPIWLTVEDDNPNRAEVLFLTDGAESDRVGDYGLVCELFDGHDEDAVAAARQRWQRYKSAGHSVAYWIQTDAGGWQKQA